MTGKRTIGWLLPETERARLLGRFPPAYRTLVAHHVTLRPGVAGDHPLPAEVTAQVVGLADDRCGVQALVVEIDGTTDRFDGSTYHITWSLEHGRQAVQSNDVIRSHGWRPVDPIDIRVRPGFVDS